MKVLGIAGSPRFGGNSDKLLERAISGAVEIGAETEVVRLCDLRISPCIECHGCDDTGVCVQADDMILLYEKLIEADRLFIASPIFFMGLPAQVKAPIDRCQCIWIRKYKMGETIGKGREFRKGFLMCVGGSPNPEKFVGAVKTVKAFLATLDITYDKELMVAGVDELGAVKKHPTALEDARRMGMEIVEG
jgi:multimeric flavodoxin WrbA